MTMKHPLLESVADRPLLIAEGSASLFQASIQYVVSHERAEEMLSSPRMSDMADDDFWGDGTDEWMNFIRPYVVVNGVLQIPISGVLLNRFPYQLGRWATGYDYIERAMQRGMEDLNVKGIALVIDSPGGEVAGCFELVDKIYEMRGDKEIRAFSADHAYSAAYALASVADSIAVTRSGGTGSVGVVTAHVDFSENLKQTGVKVTFIHAGKHKVDGNAYEALPDDVKARIQARIDKIYGVFTSTVARNRNMSEDDVRKTEALTYDAEDSLSVGFADRIGALEDEMIEFYACVAEPEGEQMTVKTNDSSATDTAAQTAAVASAREEGVTAGRAEGAKAERTRITAILGSDEGKARPKAAMSLAMKSNEDSATVISMLGDLPEEKAAVVEPPKTEAKGKSGFNLAMEKSNPGVGANDGGDKTEAQSSEEMAGGILADFQAFTGRKKKA